MVRIDTDKPADQPARAPLTPGVDLWQVAKAEETTSAKSGAQMLKLEMHRVSTLTQKYPDRVFDNVMLEGGGWGIGKEKLMALLGGPFKGDLDVLDLLNKRVWLSTGIETYDGKDRLKVLVSDPKASNGFAWCGIQHEKNVPAGHALPGEDTPF